MEGDKRTPGTQPVPGITRYNRDEERETIYVTVRFIRFGVDAPANEELDTCIRRVMLAAR